MSIEDLHDIKKFWGALGFGNVEITTAEEHDRRIAFTSQLAHIVSSSYIKSPTALKQHGFSAGSYKDMTRVARLNETMWSELFLRNSIHLVDEIDCMIENLNQYKASIQANDIDQLKALLKHGRELKEMADKEDMDE